MKIQHKILLGLFFVLVSWGGIQVSEAHAVWMDSSWLYRKQISVNRTLLTGDLTNFPIRVALTSSNFDFTKTISSGTDIRFTDSGGTTTISFEREFYGTTSQVGEFWVKLPTASSSATTTFYIYYGNSLASDASDGQTTFNMYDYVSHNYDVSGSSTIYESAMFNTTTKLGTTDPNEATGRIRFGQNYDGNDTSTAAMNLQGLGAITIEVEETSAETATHHTLVGSGADASGAASAYNYDLFHYGSNNSLGNKLHADIQGAASVFCNVTGATGFTTTSESVFISMTWNGTVCTLYQNGTFDASSSAAGTMNSSGGNLHFGAQRTNGTARNFSNGVLDEIRIASTTMSAAWLRATYHSNHNELTSFGSEETETAAASARRRPPMLIE